jgi:prepilin-type N-terminal cleavage/methylation domain-containing protein/prepilin-type processing-associated H-X9-DG protein
MDRLSCHRPLKGFTLIEVLVVVAIIALLVAILVPSLRLAREQAKGTVCGTQLKEIFNGILMYTQSYDDRLPFFASANMVDISGMGWWGTQIAPNLGKQLDVYRCPSDNNPYVVQVALRSGTIVLPKDAPPDAEPFDLLNSYRGTCDSVEFLDIGAMPRKITSFNRPYDAFLLIEAVGQTNDRLQCFFNLHVENLLDPVVINGQAQPHPYLDTWRRHVGQSNLMFIDGHVSMVRPEQAVKLAARQQFRMLGH